MDTAADSERTPASRGDTSAPEPGRPAAEPRSGPVPAALVFDDPLDRPSADDTDRGWGELPAGSADDDFTRFLREKPPHHL